MTTRFGVRGVELLAEARLCDPECEALLPNASVTLEQDAGRHVIARDHACEARTERGMTEQGD